MAVLKTDDNKNSGMKNDQLLLAIAKTSWCNLRKARTIWTGERP